MKRAPELSGLSRDHHTGLVIARHASNAAGVSEAKARTEWQRIIEHFNVEIEPHFRIEEQALLPALEDAGETTLVARTLCEHARLRELVLEPSPRNLAEFADLLRDHIRFEERVLFVKAQTRLSAAALAAIAALYESVTGV